MKILKLFEFKRNETNMDEIFIHLSKCEYDFKPNLSSYVDLNLYSKKLFEKAERFEVWKNESLIGLLAVYINKNDNSLFISNLSLDKELRGQNIGTKLIDFMLNDFKTNNIFFESIRLEVKKDNIIAIKFYERYGFKFLTLGVGDVMIYEKKI